MKILVQWTNQSAGDWRELDSADWKNLPARPLPVGGETIDDGEGYIYALNIQGMVFRGADHYHVEEIPDGCRVTTWADDAEDRPPEDCYAEVWTFKHLAPDPNFGGAYNTRQTSIGYFTGEAYDRKIAAGPYDSREILPLSDFVAPTANVIHGVWVPDAQASAHDKARSAKTWREWVDGVDPSCIQDGKVCAQRSLGRYKKPDGTRTWYATNTSTASNPHTADQELAFLAEPSGSAANVTHTESATTVWNQQWVWTTGALGNGESDWPNGTYRFQLDVTTADSPIVYGVKTLNSVAGHFARLDSFPSYAHAQTWEQAEGTFSGTGLKLATTGTINPSAGAETDAWEVVVCIYCDGSSMHGDATFTMQVNETDDFTDGPWTLVPLVRTRTVGADLIVAQRLTKTVDADLLVIGNGTVSADADLIVAEQKTVSADADLIVQDAAASVEVTVDADLIVAQRATISADADLLVIGNGTVSADADLLVANRNTVAANADLIVAQRATVGTDADVIVSQRVEVSVDADAIVAQRIEVSADADLLAAERKTVAADADALVAQRGTVAVDADLIVADAGATSTVTVDADLIVAQRLTVAVDADVLVIGNAEVSTDADALVAERKTVAAAADLIVAERKTIGTDADLLVIGNAEVSADADLLVAQRLTVAVGADLYVKNVRDFRPRVDGPADAGWQKNTTTRWGALGGDIIPGTDDTTYIYVESDWVGKIGQEAVHGLEAIPASEKKGTVYGVAVRHRVIAFDSGGPGGDAITETSVKMRYGADDYVGPWHDSSIPADGIHWDFEDVFTNTIAQGPNNKFQWDDIKLDPLTRGFYIAANVKGTGPIPNTTSWVRVTEYYVHVITEKEQWERDNYSGGPDAYDEGIQDGTLIYGQLANTTFGTPLTANFGIIECDADLLVAERKSVSCDADLLVAERKEVTVGADLIVQNAAAVDPTTAVVVALRAKDSATFAARAVDSLTFPMESHDATVEMKSVDARTFTLKSKDSVTFSLKEGS